MKKITLFFTILLLNVFFAASASEVISTIDVQRGERWWGIFAGDTIPQPFGKSFEVNTAESPGYVPVMLSSTGRYIWSPEPVEIEYDGKKITISSQHRKVEVQKGGKNLREAYLVWRHKHNINEGKMPDVNNFSSINYYCDGIWGDKGLVEYAQLLKNMGIHSGTIVIPDCWRSVHGYHFDKELYPDIKQTIGRMEDMGFGMRLTLSTKVIPYGPHFWEGTRNGMIVKRDGEYYYNWEMPQVLEMMKNLAEKSTKEYGIKSFQVLDGSGDNKIADKMWERYAKEANIPNYMVMYNYDPRMDDMAYNVNIITSSGLVGRTINGFTPIEFTEEIDMPLTLDQIEAFNRIGVTMPVAQLYMPLRLLENEDYRVAAVKVVDFRGKLTQYILSMVSDAKVTAEPMIRHMEYQFPKQGFANCDTQYMLGSKYMFVVVPTGMSKVMVRLPKGKWRGFDGRSYKGPLVTEINVPRAEPVWFELDGRAK